MTQKNSTGTGSIRFCGYVFYNLILKNLVLPECESEDKNKEITKDKSSKEIVLSNRTVLERLVGIYAPEFDFVGGRNENALKKAVSEYKSRGDKESPFFPTDQYEAFSQRVLTSYYDVYDMVVELIKAVFPDDFRKLSFCRDTLQVLLCDEKLTSAALDGIRVGNLPLYTVSEVMDAFDNGKTISVDVCPFFISCMLLAYREGDIPQDIKGLEVTSARVVDPKRMALALSMLLAEDGISTAEGCVRKYDLNREIPELKKQDTEKPKHLLDALICIAKSVKKNYLNWGKGLNDNETAANCYKELIDKVTRRVNTDRTFSQARDKKTMALEEFDCGNMIRLDNTATTLLASMKKNHAYSPYSWNELLYLTRFITQFQDFYEFFRFLKYEKLHMNNNELNEDKLRRIVGYWEGMRQTSPFSSEQIVTLVQSTVGLVNRYLRFVDDYLHITEEKEEYLGDDGKRHIRSTVVIPGGQKRAEYENAFIEIKKDYFKLYDDFKCLAWEVMRLIRQGSDDATDVKLFSRERIGSADLSSERYESLSCQKSELTFNTLETLFAKRGLPFDESHQRNLQIILPSGRYSNLGLWLSDQCPQLLTVIYFVDREKKKTAFAGSLLDQYENALAFLKEHTASPDGSYPEEALRAALLNCIIHADYFGEQTTEICICEKRVHFVNACTDTRDTFLTESDGRCDDKYTSKRLPSWVDKGKAAFMILNGRRFVTNPMLEQVFYRLGLTNAYGTGFSTMLSAYENQGMELPEGWFSCSLFQSFDVLLPIIPNTPAPSVQ